MVDSFGLKSLRAKNFKDVRNSTLDVSYEDLRLHRVYRLIISQFQKVFAINLPGLSDKFDAMKVSASLTGFNFDIIEGVKGEDGSEKAIGVNVDHVRNLYGNSDREQRRLKNQKGNSTSLGAGGHT